MRTINLSTQGKNKNKYFAIIDDEDYEYLSQFRWNVHIQVNTNYAFRTLNNGHSIIMHRLIMGVKNNMQVDHIDGNGLNNQKSNLRVCTSSNNHKNRRKSKGKSSVYKGVCFHKLRNIWVAYICVNYKLYNLGAFKDEVSAAEMYDKEAKKHFGEFAKTNF